MDYYNIIIVEDEEDIRNGLAHVVDWESMGFRISEVFSDGETALTYLMNNDVDVIISDIVMPNMTGLDIAKWIQNNKPQIMVVLLSGYSDFSYAQQAIRYNVKNYLLKPTNIDEIYEVFTQIRKDLEKQTLESKDQREKNKKQEKAQMLFRQMMFGKFLNEGVPEDTTFSNILETSGFKEGTDQYSWWFCTLESRINSLAHKDADIISSILNGGNGIFSSVPVQIQADIIDLIIWSDTKNDCKNDHVEKYLASKMTAVKSLLGHDLKIETVSYFSDLRLLIINNFKGFQKNISENIDVSENYTNTEGNLEKWVENIKFALAENDIETIVNHMSSILQSSLKEKLELLRKCAMFLIFELRINFIDNMLEIPVLFKDESVYQKIILTDSVDVILEYCKQVLEEYKKFIGLIGKPHIRKVKEYIEEHIFEEINISHIARLVYLNPTYLSRMFKKETGENITGYILRHKMEKARELLADPRYKVYEIGEIIGYKDVRHFYKVFKRTYGYTPQDYRSKA